MTPANRFLFRIALAADDPGDGDLQVDTSNATLLAREAELRTLWEHPGSDNITRNLDPPYTLELFPWYAEASDGIYAYHAGTFRVRTMGDLDSPPRLLLTARGAAPMGETLGILLLVFPAGGVGSVGPTTRGVTASVTTTSTTVTDLTITVDLATAARPALADFAATPEETGRLPLIDVYVGAWCTIGGGGGAKGELYGVTLSLVSP